MSRKSDRGGAGKLTAVRHRRAEILFGAAAFLAALFLLSQVGNQTSWAAGRSFVAQPAFWPAVSIGGMLLFGAIELMAAWRRNRSRRGDSIVAEVFVWARAVEYVGWFMAYVGLVPVVGYLPTTVAFCSALAWRLGYRRRATLAAAVLTGVVTVVVFKSFLSVRVPGGACYEWLPDKLRNFFIVYL